MRIAMLITALNPGGAERAFANLAVGLVRRGWDVRVAALGNPPERPVYLEQLQGAGIRPRFFGCSRALHFPMALWEVRNWLLQQQCDLVQSFLFHANVAAGVSTAGNGLPLVTGIRNTDATIWRLPIERLACGHAQAAICVSREARRHALSRIGLERRQLRVINNGIDLTDVRWKVAAKNSESRTWLILGRLDAPKGIDWLLPHLPRLLREFPDRRVRLVGDGPDRELVQSLVEEYGLGNHVELAGWSPEPHRELAGCELLLLPSRREGMPNVVLEAMTRGRPVVASRVGGVSKLLGENHAEQSFRFGDADGLARCVRAIAGNPMRAAELGAANRRRVETCFSLERTIDRYVAVYEEVLGRSGRSAPAPWRAAA